VKIGTVCAAVLTQVTGLAILARAMIHTPAFHRAMRSMMHTSQIRKVSQVARGIELVGLPQLECIIRSKRRIIYFSETESWRNLSSTSGRASKNFEDSRVCPALTYIHIALELGKDPTFLGRTSRYSSAADGSASIFRSFVILTFWLTRTPWISAFDSVL
jgi:hypothetical protein